MALRMAAMGAALSKRKAPRFGHHAQLLPQRVEIGALRLVLQSRIEVHENFAADRRIAGFECFLDGPRRVEVDGGVHGAQCMLQSLGIGRLLPDLDVGEQTEDRAAPIGAAPTVGVVEPLVARFRQSPRHPLDELAPDELIREIARMNARDALDIDSKTFGEPVVPHLERRKSQMHHFVHHHPVGNERGLVRFGPHADADRGRIAPGLPIGNAAAIGRQHEKLQLRHRKPAVVARHRLGRALDPGKQFDLCQFQLARPEPDGDLAAADLKCLVRQPVEGRIGHDLAVEGVLRAHGHLAPERGAASHGRQRGQHCAARECGRHIGGSWGLRVEPIRGRRAEGPIWQPVTELCWVDLAS